MYGYFRPYDCGLTNAERRLFNNYYCRICYCLRLRGGQIARYLTTFDAALYSIILKLAGGGQVPPALPCQKIRRGNLRYFREDAMGLRLADLSLVAFGEKIRDDKLDGESARAGMGNVLFGRAIKRAQRTEPEFQRIFSEGMDRINVMQSEGRDMQSLLDKYAAVSVDMFAEFCPLGEGYRALFYALASWIYYVDMLCDYDEDAEKHAPNPLREENCPTLASYFDSHYAEVMQTSRAMGTALIDAVLAVKSDEKEWAVLYKIVSYAVDSVVPSILLGKDVKFHYLREVRKNHRDEMRRKKFYREENQ